MYKDPFVKMCKTCQLHAVRYVFTIISECPEEHLNFISNLAMKCAPIRYPCTKNAVKCCPSTVVNPTEAAAIDGAVFLEQIEEE